MKHYVMNYTKETIKSDGNRLSNTSDSSIRLTIVDEDYVGLLRKKNSKNEWKDRKVILKPNKLLGIIIRYGKVTGEIKESIYFHLIDEVKINKEGVLVLKVLSDKDYCFKGEHLIEWEKQIKARIQRCVEKCSKYSRLSMDINTLDFTSDLIVSRSPSKLSNSVSTTAIAGTLKVKTQCTFSYSIAFQDRYVIVQNLFLRVFMNKFDVNEVFCMDLATCNFVRPYSPKISCLVFEVDDSGKVIQFQATNNKEMNVWVRVLEKVRLKAKSLAKARKEEQLERQKSPRVRHFDDFGEVEFQRNVRQDLEELYPTELFFEPTMTLTKHLEKATDLVHYLLDFVPETQHSQHFTARYDILASMMLEVGECITQRLGKVLFGHELSNVADNVTTETKEVGGCTDSITNISAKPNTNSPLRAEEFAYEYNRSLDHVAFTKSTLLEQASLAELNELICWLEDYQNTLKSIICPRNKIHNGNPKASVLIDRLPWICAVYVYGGTEGSKGGAAAHLFDHCHNVWELFLANPVEQLRQHGTSHYFYTEAPIGIWEAINQHIYLATSTQSPILHVMVSDKVVSSLNRWITAVITFVKTFTTSNNHSANNRPELKEIELELVCAIANDTVLHIQEVVDLVEQFQIPEVRDIVDTIFDTFSANLVLCGQVCLERLCRIVLHDVDSTIQELFTVKWMEGKQMEVAVATFEDYLRDLTDFLKSYWANKFLYTMLESIIIRYLRALLFHECSDIGVYEIVDASALVATNTAHTRTNGSGKSPANQHKRRSSTKAVLDYFSITNTHATTDHYDNTATITTSTSNKFLLDPKQNRCDFNELLGRMAHDINTLHHFISKYVDKETTEELFMLLIEVQLLLEYDAMEITSRVLKRISAFPSAAAAMFEIGKACMQLRLNTDLSDDDFDTYRSELLPALQCSPLVVKENEANNIVEGKLGLLFISLVPSSVLEHHSDDVKEKHGTFTIAKRMKMLSRIPLLFGSSVKSSTAVDNGNITNVMVKNTTPDVHVDYHDEIDNMDENSSEEEQSEHGHVSEDTGFDNPSDTMNYLTLLNRSSSAFIDRFSMAVNQGSFSVKNATTGAIPSDQLVGNVLQAIHYEHEIEEAIATAAEEQIAYERSKKNEIGVIDYSCYMEKKGGFLKSFWQRRFFKLTTKPTGVIENPYIYRLMWYSHEGANVKKSLDLTTVDTVKLLNCSRPVAFVVLTALGEIQTRQSRGFSTANYDYKLMLQSEAEKLHNTEKNVYSVTPIALHHELTNQSTVDKDYVAFSIQVTAGKRYYLRCDNIDVVAKWISLISMVCGMAYDRQTGLWNRTGMKLLREEQLKQQQTVRQYLSSNAIRANVKNS